MPTSGVTAWSLTARDIITAALQENAIVGLGRTPTATEAEACMVRLNGMLKSWPAYGLHETTGTITIPANDASGTLAAGIKRITSARLQLSATNERHLGEWNRDDYLILPNKTASGDPTIFYQARQLAGITLYVWPVPTAIKTLHIDYERVPETVTSLSETVDFPQEYQECLYANLALRCAGLFGVEPGGELIARAQRLERAMLDAERPESYKFEPGGYCA